MRQTLAVRCFFIAYSLLRPDVSCIHTNTSHATCHISSILSRSALGDPRRGRPVAPLRRRRKRRQQSQRQRLPDPLFVVIRQWRRRVGFLVAAIGVSSWSVRLCAEGPGGCGRCGFGAWAGGRDRGQPGGRVGPAVRRGNEGQQATGTCEAGSHSGDSPRPHSYQYVCGAGSHSGGSLELLILCACGNGGRTETVTSVQMQSYLYCIPDPSACQPWPLSRACCQQ